VYKHWEFFLKPTDRHPPLVCVSVLQARSRETVFEAKRKKKLLKKKNQLFEKSELRNQNCIQEINIAADTILNC